MNWDKLDDISIKEMTAEDIVDCILHYESTLKKLKDILPITCMKNGHKWGEPIKKNIEVYKTRYKRGPCDFDGSEMAPGKDIQVWSHNDIVWERRCLLCYKTVSLSGTKVVEVNPFA